MRSIDSCTKYLHIENELFICMLTYGQSVITSISVGWVAAFLACLWLIMLICAVLLFQYEGMRGSIHRDYNKKKTVEHLLHLIRT